jgi:hypothetical protein
MMMTMTTDTPVSVKRQRLKSEEVKNEMHFNVMGEEEDRPTPLKMFRSSVDNSMRLRKKNCRECEQQKNVMLINPAALLRVLSTSSRIEAFV